MSIKRKLVTLVALPLFGFLCLGLYLGNENYKSYKNLRQINDIVMFSTKISLLVHELQKERGYSAGFLGAKGKEFSQELENQKKITNNRKIEFITYLKKFKANKYNNNFNKTLNNAMENLLLIEIKRKMTKNLLINSYEIITFYSNINKLLIDSIAKLNKDVSNSQLNRQFMAYEQFSRAKDAAGLERAIVANALTKSYFDSYMLTWFQKLINSQNIHINHFNNYAEIYSIKYFEKQMLNKKIKEVNKIRKNLLASNFDDSAKYWFGLATFKINKLKEVDSFLLNDIKRNILILQNEFKYSMYYFISFCLIISLIVIICGHFISMNISNLFDGFVSKIDIFFKYMNKEVQDISLFENELDDEIIGSKVNDLNRKILQSKELLVENNKFLDEALSLSKLYEYAIEKSNLILRVSLDKKITYANESYCRISEYSKDELVGQSYNIIKHPDINDEEIEKMWEYVDKGNIWKGTLKNISKTGETHYSMTTIVPIKNKEGKILEYMGIRQDITEVINLHKEIEDTQREVIYKMGEIGETRSKETGYHVKRVAEYTKILALKAGLPLKEAELLKFASPMHDIGKVGIPDSILNKKGKLTVEEFEIMKGHAQLGYEMFKDSTRPMLMASAIIAEQHHEKYDGTGYPKGRKGEKIHLYGRISAICDVFDALGSNRAYKKAWELDKILDYFKKERGSHFDPRLVDLFLDNLDEFLEIRDAHEEKYLKIG